MVLKYRDHLESWYMMLAVQLELYSVEETVLCAYVTNVRVPIVSFSQTSLLFYAIITHGVGNLKTLMKIRNLDGMGENGR